MGEEREKFLVVAGRLKKRNKNRNEELPMIFLSSTQICSLFCFLSRCDKISILFFLLRAKLAKKGSAHFRRKNRDFFSFNRLHS